MGYFSKKKWHIRSMGRVLQEEDDEEDDDEENEKSKNTVKS